MSRDIDAAYALCVSVRPDLPALARRNPVAAKIAHDLLTVVDWLYTELHSRYRLAGFTDAELRSELDRRVRARA
jgi:hypothetical protein